MKHKQLHRLGALALAVILALSMAVTPAMAANPTSIRITLDGKVVTNQTITVEQDQLIKLECIDQSGNPAKVAWSKDGNGVTMNQSGGVRGKVPGTVTTITATALDENGDPVIVGSREVTATCQVTVREPIPVTGVTLNQTSLRLNPGDTAQLTATVAPANADDKTVTWNSDNTSVATVDENGLVTAVAGDGATAKITAMAGAEKAECTVSVGPKPDGFTAEDVKGIKIATRNTLDLGLAKAGDTQRVPITPDPATAVFTYESVVWSVEDADGKADSSVIRVAKDPASFGTGGRSAVVTAVGPGAVKLVVTSGTARSEWNVEIPGITLRGNVLQITGGRLTMWEGQVETLLVNRFGGADNSGSIIWSSSDESIVSVYNGRLTARMPGTVKITASLVGYPDAEVTVTVQEDTSALIQGGSVTAGGSLNLSSIAGQLNSISVSKTGSALSYITNLSVPTSQGIVHDSYRSEPDTGAGVGATDRFYLSGNTALGQTPLSHLSFVARNTFSGTANIGYTGCTVDNQFFSGTIRVTVSAASDVWYSAVAEQPLSFQADDFNRICQSKQGGRSLSYVTFTLPQSSWGELRYDYNGATHPGQAVVSGAQYYRSRTPSLDRISFIPSSTCPSSVAIAYRATDANGGSYSGVVTISVTKASGGSSLSDVRLSGVRGERVAFPASAFNAACVSTIGETLSYVRFGSLPASSEGVLYVNYWASGSYSGMVSANTSYYYSGVPNLGTISFVSTSTAPDQVAIPYTGYGAKGTVYTGTVYISLNDANQSGTRYSVISGKSVSFNVNDFNNACINATGASLNYVRFNTTPSSTQGYLRYRYISGSNYGAVYTSTQCYRVNPNSWSSTALIGNVYFQANAGYVGTITLPYTGYNTNGISFTGEVVIEVTPNTITYTGTNANPLQISASQVSSACSGLMSRPLSYITLNNLPASTAGRLYVGYTSLGTGTPANTGTRYYVSSNPNISQLSFVPRGRYEGQVTVGYTAVSTSGEQITGQILFNIIPATSSRYFRDMGNHVWAASAADYLRLNGISNGWGGNTTFVPAQKVMRRDFMVMLNRAFKFPYAGSYSFSDVSTNAYYSQALASAKQLGIVSAADNRFRPAEGLTREDAMVMIYNTLVAMGKTPISGTEADLARFTDNAQISSSARNAVASLVRLGVIRGSNGKLNPKETITRAETAIILHYVLTM